MKLPVFLPLLLLLCPLSALPCELDTRMLPLEQTCNGKPLAPTRQISFTTSRGTWMSLDISPDGSRMVFDLLGNL